jgi:myo-inositol-1(or 4)-monophosphatase
MIAERLSLASGLARQAGDILRQAYGQAVEAKHKGEVDLVTEFDLRAEHLLTQALRAAFPQDAILAEEGGSSGSGELTWVIDPLDGTTLRPWRPPLLRLDRLRPRPPASSRRGL